MEESTYFSTDLSAISAAINVAFDIAAIATYLQGYYERGPYEVNDPPPGFNIEQKSLFLMAVITALSLFGGGCVVRAVLAYKIRGSQTICERLETAARAFLQLELAYMAYKRLPGTTVEDKKMIRMVKMVDLAIKMPSTCLALIVYVLYALVRAVYQVDNYKGLGSSKDLDILLIVTAVFGILTSSITAAETLIDKPWSLWHHADYSTVRSQGKTRYSIVRWLATAVSLLSHVLVYLLLSPQLRGVTFAVIAGWWVVCTLVYYASCRQIWRSIRCGYLSALMNLPFNPATASIPQQHSLNLKDVELTPAGVIKIMTDVNPTGNNSVSSGSIGTVTAAAGAVPVARIPAGPAAAAAAAASVTSAPAGHVPNRTSNTSGVDSKRVWWLSALLTLIFCGSGMTLGALQARSCYFTTYRCISTSVGYGIQANCTMLYNVTVLQHLNSSTAAAGSVLQQQQQFGLGRKLSQVSGTVASPNSNILSTMLSELSTSTSAPSPVGTVSSDLSDYVADSPPIPDSPIQTLVDGVDSVTYTVGAAVDYATYYQTPYDSSYNNQPSSTDSITNAGSARPGSSASTSAGRLTESNNGVTNVTLYQLKRSVGGKCRPSDTKLEPRIGYVTAVFVGLDGLLFAVMCVLAAYGLA